MKKTKWYWWIPVVGAFFYNKISEWVWEPESIYDRLDRAQTGKLIMLMHLLIGISILSFMNAGIMLYLCK